MSATDSLVTVVQTVLVVDDEVLVRMVIAAYLRDCGYRVIEASDAVEAMLVITHDELRAINVVLSDVAMPGEIDGFGLARWIRARRADVDVVLTGTPRRAAEAAGDLCEHGPMQAKPYAPQLVVDRIRRLLARRPRPTA